MQPNVPPNTATANPPVAHAGRDIFSKVANHLTSFIFSPF